MQDPRAAMQRGPLPANVPAPRGLLGDAPNDRDKEALYFL